MINSESRSKNSSENNSESGSVLFYILIAVALLAALSYAVSSSGRGGTSQINKERSRLSASEIIEYSNIVSNAVAQLRLRGTPDTSLCFDDPKWGAANYNHAGCSDNGNRIFHPDGGGVIWRKAAIEAMDSAATPDNLWHITGVNHVKNIGTTCAAITCSELILYTNELLLDVCLKLNDLLGVDNPGGIPVTEADFNDNRFLGVFGNEDTIGAAVSSPIEGKYAGCFKETTSGTYHYYKVLQAR